MAIMDIAWWRDRLARVDAQIVLYEDAIDALVTRPWQEYLLDTGQSRQRVTYIDLGKLQATLDSLLNRRATIYARITGCNTLTAVPSW